MKRFAAILICLGIFWAQTSALDTFVLRDPVSNYVTGTMTVHSEEHIVDVHVRSGVYSSDTIFDYRHGYIATRLFSRNACFIMKIKKELIPELREIGRLAFEREAELSEGDWKYCLEVNWSSGPFCVSPVAHLQQNLLPINITHYGSNTAQTMKNVYSPNNVWAEFQAGNSRLGHLKDWLLYGKHIENLCTGLPLYQLVATEPTMNVDGCANAGIPSILGLKICEELIATGS